jgi:hypothetical protein
MATRAAKAGRDAEIQKRQMAVVAALAEAFGVEPAPAFPFVRDPEFRAIDEREVMTITLERILAAAQEEAA